MGRGHGMGRAHRTGPWDGMGRDRGMGRDHGMGWAKFVIRGVLFAGSGLEVAGPRLVRRVAIVLSGVSNLPVFAALSSSAASGSSAVLTPFRTMAVSYLNKLFAIIFKVIRCAASVWGDGKPDHPRGWGGKQEYRTTR